MATSKFITAALLAASITTPVHAGLMTGAELKQHCDPDVGSFENGFCTGCIGGMAFGLQMGVMIATNNKSSYYCPPSSISIDQVQAIVMKYINDNPAKWQDRADELIAVAMVEAFPCKGGK